MAWIDTGDIRALARLPHLDVEVLHRPARHGRGDQMAILLSASTAGSPLFLFGFAQPMLLWMCWAETVWAPWYALAEAIESAPRQN